MLQAPDLLLMVGFETVGHKSIVADFTKTESFYDHKTDKCKTKYTIWVKLFKVVKFLLEVNRETFFMDLKNRISSLKFWSRSEKFTKDFLYKIKKDFLYSRSILRVSRSQE